MSVTVPSPVISFSARFHVLNVHTMDELKLTGNSMLGSRPLLNFDAKFSQTPHWK